MIEDPYSDLELLVLHSEVDPEATAEEKRCWGTHCWPCIFIILLLCWKVMIVRLKETPHFKVSINKHNAGFHLDSSCHVLIRDKNIK